MRFVYVHKRDWYLKLQDDRDVIELPISDELDVSGWDLKKALRLLLKPNPVMLEWLSSPIRYAWNDALVEPIMNLGKQVDIYTTAVYHYQHLALSQWEKYLEGRESVRQKKYFYALRPALALRWLRLNGTTPPMNMQDLMVGCALCPEETLIIGTMIDQKMKTREMGEGARFEVIDNLILDALEWAKSNKPEKQKQGLWDEANQCFLEILDMTNR